MWLLNIYDSKRYRSIERLLLILQNKHTKNAEIMI